MMKNFNEPFWLGLIVTERSAVKQYLFAITLSVISLCLVYFLWKTEGGTPLTSLVLVSVILSAIYGGKRPALVSVFIGALGVDYFFSNPLFTVFDSSSSYIRIFVYAFIGLMVTKLVTFLKEALKDTSVKKTQLEFEKKARENVLSIVSHDLRSPLSSIIMNADLIFRQLKPDKEARMIKQLQNIKGSGMRMNALIEDLLDSVKIESGQFKIEMAQNNIDQIIQKAVGESLSAADIKGIELKTRVIVGDIYSICDERRIIQVLNNLIGNAIKFSPEGGEVSITADTVDDKILIKVSDSGPGISQEDQAHLFEKFWQAQKTAHKGTGLGLFISKEIIESHKGEIRVSSSVGKGATFYISLPLMLTEKTIKEEQTYVYKNEVQKNNGDQSLNF